MSIKSHLEKAEDSARQALINALAEGEDYYLTDLFNLLNDVRELNQKVGNTIRFTDNSSQWESDRLEYNFNLLITFDVILRYHSSVIAYQHRTMSIYLSSFSIAPEICIFWLSKLGWFITLNVIIHFFSVR